MLFVFITTNSGFAVLVVVFIPEKGNFWMDTNYRNGLLIKKVGRPAVGSRPLTMDKKRYPHRVLYVFPFITRLAGPRLVREEVYLSALASHYEKFTVLSPDHENLNMGGAEHIFLDAGRFINKVKYNLYLTHKELIAEHDIIYCQAVSGYLPIFPWYWVCRGKAFIDGYRWEWSSFEKRSGYSLEAFGKKMLEELFFRSTDLATVPTQNAKHALQERFPRLPVAIVPNFVDVETFAPKTNYRLKNSKNAVRLITIGRLHPDKNYPLLLQSVQLLRDQINCPISLTVVGSGPEVGVLNKIKGESGISLNHFLSIENTRIAKLLHNHDIFIMTSLHEGHPKALIEAMSCGLPCLATNVLGTRDVIVDGETGLLASETVEGVTRQLKRLVDDLALRERLGRAAREQAVREWTLDRVIAMEVTAIQKAWKLRCKRGGGTNGATN